MTYLSKTIDQNGVNFGYLHLGTTEKWFIIFTAYKQLMKMLLINMYA